MHHAYDAQGNLTSFTGPDDADPGAAPLVPDTGEPASTAHFNYHASDGRELARTQAGRKKEHNGH